MGHSQRESEMGSITGTADKDYNLIWFVQSCLANTLRLETYLQDAARTGDAELSELFGKARADSRKGAEIGKRLLAARLGSASGARATGAATDVQETPGRVLPDSARARMHRRLAEPGAGEPPKARG